MPQYYSRQNVDEQIANDDKDARGVGDNGLYGERHGRPQGKPVLQTDFSNTPLVGDPLRALLIPVERPFAV
jgi:hypothetical protein